MVEPYFRVGRPGALGGVERYRDAFSKRLRRREAKERLAKLDEYTMYRPRRVRFPRRKVVAYGILDLFEADLYDVQSYASKNEGNRYILIVKKLLYTASFSRSSALETCRTCNTCIRKNIFTCRCPGPFTH